MITNKNSSEFRVYCLKRESSNEIFYIGLTKFSIKFRYQQHVAQSKNDISSDKGVFINKLWRYNDDFIIEELCWFSSICEHSKHIETSYILTAIKNGINLKNMSKKKYDQSACQFIPIIESVVYSHYRPYRGSNKKIKVREIP